MNRKVVVANLIKCANELDKNKLYKEANELTGVIKRLAQYTFGDIDTEIKLQKQDNALILISDEEFDDEITHGYKRQIYSGLLDMPIDNNGKNIYQIVEDAYSHMLKQGDIISFRRRFSKDLNVTIYSSRKKRQKSHSMFDNNKDKHGNPKNEYQDYDKGYGNLYQNELMADNEGLSLEEYMEKYNIEPENYSF
jgi:hypothetical protein